MRNDVLAFVEDLADYRTVLGAIMRENKAFTDEEAAGLLSIYQENAERSFGFTAPELVKALLVLDAAQDGAEHPATASGLAGLLSEADRSGLDALCALCDSFGRTPELALAAKEAALAGGVSGTLALALTRAALDTLAGQQDVAGYREDIEALATVLTDADEELFAQASRFLGRMRQRSRRGQA